MRRTEIIDFAKRTLREGIVARLSIEKVEIDIGDRLVRLIKNVAILRWRGSANG